MTHPCTVTPMSRTWAASDTPQARAEIPPAAWSYLWHEAHAEDAYRDRIAVLRKHYGAGVDARDLVRLENEAGLRVSVGHMFRLIRGARPGTA